MLACAAATTLSFQGCAIRAASYVPSLDNVETMKKSTMQPLALGSFSVNAGAEGATSIGVRGSSMTSPVGADYAAYLAEAIRQELQLAGKLDAKSDIEISGVLLKNDIQAGGFSTNSGEIEARFVVKRGGAVRYEGAKRTSASWDSSFVGAVAIPKAQQQYPLLVQNLVGQLLADKAFSEAVK
jgi:hypothetical protein